MYWKIFTWQEFDDSQDSIGCFYVWVRASAVWERVIVVDSLRQLACNGIDIITSNDVPTSPSL